MAWWWGREALRRTRSATLDTHRTGKGAFEFMEAVMTMMGRVAGLWRYPAELEPQIKSSWRARRIASPRCAAASFRKMLLRCDLTVLTEITHLLLIPPPTP